MTAINVYASPGDDAAYMITDSAVYGLRGANAGVVREFREKMVIPPRLKAAFAACGESQTVALVGEACASFASYDEMIRRLPGCLREMAADGEFTRDGDNPDDDVNRFRLFVAGWSDERRRPEGYSLQSTRASSGDGALMPVFGWTAGQRILCQPGHAEMLQGLKELGFVKQGQVVVKDPAVFLTALIDWQRRNCKFDNVGGTYCIGGAATLTRIDAKGVTQSVVHQWNDHIDQLIDPSQDAVNVVPLRIPEGLSRLQRERMEKKIKKGTLRTAG
jgi:hypothetical protein